MELLDQVFNLRGALLAALIFVPLERIAPMRRDQAILRPGWKNDLIYLFVNAILTRFGLILIAAGAMAAGAVLLPAEVGRAIAAQPLVLQIVELIVLGDLGFYAIHRLFHAVPWLWNFHAVHHSIEDMDWLAAHRVHPVDQILTRGGSLAPCFLLGFSDAAIGLYAVIFYWHSLTLHANVRVSLGPLRWVITSSAFHHWHHSSDPAAWNRNFGAQLPLWDLVFRTAYAPKGQRPTGYGIGDPVPTRYAAQLAYPLTAGRPPDPAQARS